ncbi:hypothetical protein HELRODRAFT_158439 [Helobdella robusta]|uniref:Uncharacterized protein n=1 Tax=Helobdella robusta TaxID=6412 RepID=T1EMS5_HELRO|nr:hypothetical protein HELRODRAFT_158439 [Helobdella robusta]ESO12032.1 hypothetical protein HELRODRAFT_158439 [Helobdella robusta]
MPLNGADDNNMQILKNHPPSGQYISLKYAIKGVCKQEDCADEEDGHVNNANNVGVGDFDVGSVVVAVGGDDVAITEDDLAGVENEKNEPVKDQTASKMSSGEKGSEIEREYAPRRKFNLRRYADELSNVTRCTSDNLVEHLKLIGVEVISGFPVLKKSFNDRPQANKFSSLTEDVESWPEHVRISHWSFLQKSRKDNSSDNKTKESSGP